MGSVDDSFCLKWNDFHTSVTASFADLRSEADLFDITLVCEGKPLMAHKLILSACSEVFKEMLRASKNAREPTILMWDIRKEDMEALLNFMYHGEVNITQDKLNHFLDLAERLQVRGLTSNGGEKEKKNKQQQSQQSTQMCLPALPTVPVPPEQVLASTSSSSSSPRKRAKLSSPPAAVTAKSQHTESDEIKTEEEEDEDARSEVSGSSSFVPPAVVTEMREDFGENNGASTSFSNDDDEGDRGGLPPLPQFDLTGGFVQSNLIEPVIGSDGSKEFPCSYCEKKYLTRSRLKRHVLDVHERGEFPCPECRKIFNSYRRLKDHQRSKYCHGATRNS